MKRPRIDIRPPALEASLGGAGHKTSSQCASFIVIRGLSGVSRYHPCVKGTRVPVSVIVGSVADGVSVEQILKSWPALHAEDVHACLKYAAEAVKDGSILRRNGRRAASRADRKPARL